jgi:hypothetical protein
MVVEALSSVHIKWLNNLARQRVRWTVPVTQPMMLCSQVQRSGGTLLTRLFDGHPACFGHPFELQWGRPRKFHWPKLDLSSAVTPDDLFARLNERWPKKCAKRGYEKYSKWTHRNHPGEIQAYPFIFDPCSQREIFAAAVSAQTVRSQRAVLNAYLTSLFNAWLDYQNLYRVPKQWVTAFRARLIMEPDAADRFFADYPDGLLVTLVRDPGGWLSSFSRHMGLEDADTVLNSWIASADASLRAHAARPDRVVVLLFEDLVHRTGAVMRRLCERMNLSFSDVLLEPTYNSMPVLSGSTQVLATGIDRNVTERYRQTLTPEQLEIVTSKAMPRFREIRERFALEHRA